MGLDVDVKPDRRFWAKVGQKEGFTLFSHQHQ